MSSGYILGISRGHNAGVCLLKDGKIVFASEEERFTRHKYDGGPLATMLKVKEYTNKIDALVVCHTTTLDDGPKIEYTGDNLYSGLARKLGLIDRKTDIFNHPQVIDVSSLHHRVHAACAFYRSGFDEAVAVVIDGAGSATTGQTQDGPVTLWEVESIFDCSYPDNIKTLYKHFGCRDPIVTGITTADSSQIGEEGSFSAVVSGHAGIVKVYEAVTQYCGFQAIEAGKTMGLFPYGNSNDKIPKLFLTETKIPVSDRSLIVPTYPNAAIVNHANYDELSDSPTGDDHSWTEFQNRRDLAYACQTETQEQALDLILTAVKMSGKKKVVLSGGYGLNCVANYWYLNKLNEEGIELFVEPISNDGGTAIGSALLYYYSTSQSTEPLSREIYLGPQYSYNDEEINKLAEEYNAIVADATDEDVIELMTNKNIVAMFQGQCRKWTTCIRQQESNV